jgi:hypothetical protein
MSPKNCPCKVGEGDRLTSTVAVAPAATVNVETEGVIVGPALAASTDMEYVTALVETEVIVMVKLLVWLEDTISPKLNIAWPSPTPEGDGPVSSVALT